MKFICIHLTNNLPDNLLSLFVMPGVEGVCILFLVVQYALRGELYYRSLWLVELGCE
jgi:hypothetical protein